MREVECSNWKALREWWLGFSTSEVQLQRQWSFRGQGNVTWNLQTTLDRRFDFANDPERNEFANRLHSEFKRELFHIGDEQLMQLEGDALELYARHHGLPSVLMDWSNSPYVATYFAMKDALEIGSEHACVWALNRARFEPSPDTIDVIDDFETPAFQHQGITPTGHIFACVHYFSGYNRFAVERFGQIHYSHVRGENCLNRFGVYDHQRYLFVWQRRSRCQHCNTTTISTETIAMATDFSWTLQPLDEKDEELVRAYVDIGKPIDILPYTDDFNRLVERVRAGASDPDKHAVFVRLLTLRKQGRLPRVSAMTN